MIKGFFFDLDGTLVNTYQADYKAYRDAIQEIAGVEIAEHDFAQTHGQEMIAKLDKLVPDLSSQQIGLIAQSKKEHYRKYVSETTLNKGLVAFIESFAEHAVIVLVTTAKRENALRVLQEHDLEKYFLHMVFGEDVSNSKPHPEPYLKALALSHLDPEEVLVFEDTPTGVLSAEAAGLRVALVKEFSL